MRTADDDTIIDRMVKGRNTCVLDVDLNEYDDKVVQPVAGRLEILEKRKLAVGGRDASGDLVGIEAPDEIYFEGGTFEVSVDTDTDKITIKGKGGGGGSAAPSKNVFLGIFDTFDDMVVEANKIFSDDDFNKKVVGWVKKNVSSSLPPLREGKSPTIELADYLVYSWKAGNTDPSETQHWDTSVIPVKGQGIVVVGPLSDLPFWRPVKPANPNVPGHDWSYHMPETHDGQVVCYADYDNYKFYYSNGTAWRTYGLGSMSVTGYDESGTATEVLKTVKLDFSNNFKVTSGPDYMSVDTRGLKYGNVDIHKIEQGQGINLSIDASDGHTLLVEALGGGIGSQDRVFVGVFDEESDLFIAAKRYPEALRNGKVVGFVATYNTSASHKELMSYKVYNWKGPYFQDDDVVNINKWSVWDIAGRGQGVTIVGPYSAEYPDWVPVDPRTSTTNNWSSYGPEARQGQLVCYSKDISDDDRRWLYYYSDGNAWTSLVTEEALRYPTSLTNTAPHAQTNVDEIHQNEWRVLASSDIISKFPSQFATAAEGDKWKAESSALQTIYADVGGNHGTVQKMTGLVSGYTWERVKAESFKGVGSWSEWTLLHERGLASLDIEFKEGVFPDSPDTPEDDDHRALLWRHKLESGAQEDWKLLIFLKELKGDKGNTGDKGEIGDPGRGLDIKGVVDRQNDLTLLNPAPNLYDMYMVRGVNEVWIYYKAAPDHKHIANWQNLGKISGITGPRGPRGYQGPEGPKGASGGISTFLLQWVVDTATNSAISYVMADATAMINDAMTVAVDQMTNMMEDVAESAVNKALEDAGDSLKGDKGEKGDKGDAGKDGKSVRMVGKYNTLTEFRARYPAVAGNVGVAALIGGEHEEKVLWAITETPSFGGIPAHYTYEEMGDIRGPKGEDAAWTVSIRDSHFVQKGDMFEVVSDLPTGVAGLYIKDTDSIIVTGIKGSEASAEQVGFKMDMKYPIPTLQPKGGPLPSTVDKFLTNNGTKLEWVDVAIPNEPKDKILMKSPNGTVFAITVSNDGRLSVDEEVVA